MLGQLTNSTVTNSIRRVGERFDAAGIEDCNFARDDQSKTVKRQAKKYEKNVWRISLEVKDLLVSHFFLLHPLRKGKPFVYPYYIVDCLSEVYIVGYRIKNISGESTTACVDKLIAGSCCRNGSFDNLVELPMNYIRTRMIIMKWKFQLLKVKDDIVVDILPRKCLTRSLN